MRRPLALLVLALVPSCELIAKVDCECADPGITLRLPAGDAGDAGVIASVTASGSACSDVSPGCDGAMCHVPANGEGTCEIVVTFADGSPPFVTTVAVALSGTPSCCLVYTPEGDAASITVPEPGDALTADSLR